MKGSAASMIAAVLLAGGLTAYGNPSLEPLLRDRIERLTARVAAWADGAAAGLATGFGWEKEEHRPGPTYALIVSKDSVIGIDSEGYATCRGASFAGDHAAITGFVAECDSVGERLTAPEVALGLAVVRAFHWSGDFLDMLSEVNVEDIENPSVVLCGGIIVDIGTGNYRTKTRRLRQVLLQAPELSIRPTRVDMRFGPQVVVEYEEMQAQARKEV